MVLYVDGAQVATNTNVGRWDEPIYGYWRLGGDNLSGWPSAPSSNYFAGTLDDVAIYPTAVSLGTVQNHYVLSGRTLAGGTNIAADGCLHPVVHEPGVLVQRLGVERSRRFDRVLRVDVRRRRDGHRCHARAHLPDRRHLHRDLDRDRQQGRDQLGVEAGHGRPANAAPTASFTSSCTNLACSFDGSASSDSDGSIASYAWTFGDGATAAVGAKPAHTYAAGGTYSVTLTVTDNNGATNSIVEDGHGHGKPAGPTAAFTSSCTNLACSFNALGVERGTGRDDHGLRVGIRRQVHGDRRQAVAHVCGGRHRTR